MEAIHDELQAYQHSRNSAHHEHCGGPDHPRYGAKEANQCKDGDDERNEGKTGRQGEEKVGAVDIHRERLLPEVSTVYFHS